MPSSGDVRPEWERDWDGWFARAKPEKERLRDSWMARIRDVARNTRGETRGYIGPEGAYLAEWNDRASLAELHEEASALRNLADDEAWKVPFNRFRTIFIRRDANALQKFCSDGEDDAELWYAFMR